MNRILAVMITLALLAVWPPALGETALREALGSWEGKTYTNAFLGIGCTLPDWYYSNESEILAVNRLTEDMLDDDLKTVLKTIKSVTVMTAVADLSGTPVINIQLNYLSRNIEPIIQKTGVAAILPGQLGDIRKGFESVGAENVAVRTGTVSIAGKEEPAFIAHYSAGDVSYSAVAAFLAYDGCMTQISVTVTGDSEAAAEEVFSSFYWLNEPLQETKIKGG